MKLSFLKPLLYPWAGLLWTPRAKGVRPYFGPPSLGLGGPQLKREKLARHFGNVWLGPNIVYVTSGLPMSLSFLKWAKSRGVKILLNQDGVYTPSWYRSDCKKANERLSRIHALADFVFYQSRFCYEASRAFLKLPADQKSEILHNGVDTLAYTPKDRGGSSGSPVLLSAGYFYPSKHYALRALFQAFREVLAVHSKSKLIVAGRIVAALGESTSEAGWIEALCRQYGLPFDSVHFVGRYRVDQAPQLFHSADVFVHLKNNDPCPSIVLEAMASGLPVVYLRNGGTPELAGETGVGVDYASDLNQPDEAPPADRIAQAILEAVRIQEALGKKARLRAEQFSLTQWYNRHSSVMTQLLSP